MENILRTERGFTLIEMMIVLLIISILLLIAIPTMTKSNSVVKGKACESTVKTLQGQVAAYEMEKGHSPKSLGSLLNNNYVDSITCPGGDLQLENGKVVDKNAKK